MGKYLEVGKISMKTQTAYRFDVLVGGILPFARVLLAYFLWKALYSGKSEIAGMSFGMMVTYYIVCAFFQRLDQSSGLVWETASEIREGRFSKYMVRPVNPLGHFIMVSLSKSLYTLCITLAAAVILALAFKNCFVMPSTPVNLLCAAITGFLGLVFICLLNYLTALMAFKFNDVTGLHLLKSNIVEFLAGTLIPLSLLPAWAQDGMRFLPFYYMQYLPASLYLGLRTNEFIPGIVTLSIWIIAFWTLAEHVYRRFRTIYEGVGV